ncbi:hypothetical protein PCASD_26876 [Puccinia coronata f. sp. avenae]|uniref:Uncharacterized protein n=1 Tax=Puccinia coronata f. sp. avenae TaxID=200324 RepID=A0A2N5RTU6_9BASI|nr:hypothetical protein PCASD_26876 [Puccinia coronata f. sp. avenae]
MACSASSSNLLNKQVMTCLVAATCLPGSSHLLTKQLCRPAWLADISLLAEQV